MSRIVAALATVGLGYIGYLMFTGFGSALNAPAPIDPTPAPGVDPMTSGALPRGLRNNNPLNIIYSPANNWQGQIGSDGTFVKFDSPVNGLRAAFLLFQTHYNRGMNTLTSFIRGWSTTDQSAYIASVAATLGIDPSIQFDLSSLYIPLARAMLMVENGPAWADYYSVDVYQQALSAAGIQ